MSSICGLCQLSLNHCPLAEIWSRPILKRSSSYRTRNVPQAEERRRRRPSPNEFEETPTQTDSSRRHVSIPQSVQTGYSVAPKSNTGASGQEESHQARMINHKRLNEFKGKLKASKKL